MRRILICREYPPAPGGGIGTYALHISRLLADCGDTVHVITEQWPGARMLRTEERGGRLVIHRLPVEQPGWITGTRRHPEVPVGMARALFRSGGAAATFAWQVARHAEALVADEAIDLIEAPDYEAPLVLFQLRRAAGLGPARRPPCVVHLHSPTEFVGLGNGLTDEAASGAPVAGLERDSIRAADALLCPSHALAAAATARYGLPQGTVAVIRYPVGATEQPLRTATTWSRGTILYVGRLELRKGILEWLDAAARLAREDPNLRFAFVGSDHVDAQLGGVGVVHSRIPAACRSQFTFHEPRDREALGALLADARLAVIPSRWDNFPYTCIEAMASGLPVIVSPVGGTAEMVEHGVTGWVAEAATVEALVATTREALASGPDGLSRAGARAAEGIRELCAPGAVAAAHDALARRAIDASASRPPLPAGIGSHPTADDLERWLVDHWRQPAPGWRTRAATLAATVRRGLARPRQSARHVARHLRWRISAGAR